MARSAQIGYTLALFGAAALSWSALMPPPEPDLGTQIQEAKTVLERARNAHTVHYDPALNWRILPKVSQSQHRKDLFIAKLLPLIAEQNERVLIQRDIAETAPVGSAQYNALTHDYGLKSGASRKALLARVDKIPESLTLAQAAIESGWGTSRFAQLGHAYFGERTYDKTVPGMDPQQATGFKVKKFHSTSGSIRSFMRTLNTHRAYRAFRARRAALLAAGQHATGQELATYLKSYSEIGDDYIQRILITIKANNLDDFDGIQHVDH